MEQDSIGLMSDNELQKRGRATARPFSIPGDYSSEGLYLTANLYTDGSGLA